MKIPISWLRDYVEITETPEELADLLTFSGTEVEAIETVGSEYEGIVVGEVRAVGPHPNADRLRLCRVFNGKEELPVVCGADNVAPGVRAPFAGVGTVLPNGMALKRARIRGEESLGMLCAEDELGLSHDHAGLLLLDPTLEAGTPLVEVLGPPEIVFNLEVTWNRSDCLSVIGMAREIAALTGRSLTIPEVTVTETGPDVASFVRVNIEAEDACPRYTARVLQDIKLGPSPLWMQRRLSLCGVRAINNIVDITNYVMLESGHPLHAFDYQLLQGGQIVVRSAAPGEGMATLDETERELDAESLVIADTTQPVALAGIMGGAGSEIRESTQHVLLESASFAPAGMHRTSTRLGLTTESSHRFERGVNIETVDWAGNRAAALMSELADATVAKGMVDEYPGRAERKQVSLSFQHTADLLGVAIAGRGIVEILRRLQFPVVAEDDEGCTVEVPGFRHDISIEADLIEEIARMVGFDQVPDARIICSVTPDASDLPFQAEAACRTVLTGLGLSEAVNYSFISAQLTDLFMPDGEASRVVLPNPVSSDQSVMRPSLIPQMVDMLGRNLSRQVREAAMFELGKVFERDASGTITEHKRLCLGLLGPIGRHPQDKRRDVDAEEIFRWLKGILEALLRSQHVLDEELTSCKAVAFESGTGVEIRVGDRVLGCMGLVDRKLGSEWRMQEPVAVAELDFEILTEGAHEQADIAAVPMYPAVSRDVAMVVNSEVSHRQIEAVIRETAPPELTGLELFDIFASEGMGDGRKSLAYSLEFRSAERSLTDEDANGYQEAVKAALRAKLDAEIRDK